MSDNVATRLVSRIYDVALDESCLDDALVMLANATGCISTGLEVYGDAVDFFAGRNPLLMPGYGRSFLDYWCRHLPGRRSTAPYADLVVLRSADLYDRDQVVKSAFFNEWLRPQAMGGDGRYANIARTGATIMSLGAFKPFAAPVFSSDDERLFSLASHHLARAVAINRRLKSSALAQCAIADEHVVHAIFDQDGNCLFSNDNAAGFLSDFGVEEGAGPGGLDDDLRAMVLNRDGTKTARRTLLLRHGGRMKVTVSPISRSFASSAPWSVCDRSAILLVIDSPDHELRTKVARLAGTFSLTHAETAVVREILNGGGRAATARRLGLKESTVRSHLNSIYSKVGIHRQADLHRLVREY